MSVRKAEGTSVFGHSSESSSECDIGQGDSSLEESEGEGSGSGEEDELPMNKEIEEELQNLATMDFPVLGNGRTMVLI